MEDTIVDNNEVIDEGKVVDTPAKEAPVEKVKESLDKSAVEEIQKKAFGYAFNMVDEKLKEIGYAKPENVKTTDFIAQILTEKGTKSTEESVKDTDDDSQARIKALQEQLKEKESKLAELAESTTKQKRDFFLKSLISTAEIQAPDSLGEAEKTRYIERIKRTMESELLSNYQIKEVNDNFRLYGKDGEPIFDGTPEMNIIDPRELIKRDFSEFLTAPKVQKAVVKGTGSAETNEKVNTSASFPSTVKTKTDLYDHIESQKGFKMGSKEFANEVLKAKAEMPHLFK